MTHDKRDWYQVSLKLILKNNKNEVLTLKIPEVSNWAGYYDLPGGRIDTDELLISFEDILKREIKEEIGDISFRIHGAPVAASKAGFMSNNKEIHILYLFFEGEYISGDVMISNEHADYLWANLKTIDPARYFMPGIREGIGIYIKNLL